MATIGLEEFQEASGLSDASVMWLLKHNRLKCRVDAARGLQILFESGDMRQLTEAAAAYKAELGQRGAVLREKAGRIIRDHFEQIIEDAIQRALSQHRL